MRPVRCPVEGCEEIFPLLNTAYEMKLLVEYHIELQHEDYKKVGNGKYEKREIRKEP